MSYSEFRDCEHCGQEYWAAKPGRKYCSRACFADERWSVHDHLIRDWRDQYLSGDSYALIASRSGVSYNTVRKGLQYAGVKPRGRSEMGLKKLKELGYA